LTVGQETIVNLHPSNLAHALRFGTGLLSLLTFVAAFLRATAQTSPPTPPATTAVLPPVIPLRYTNTFSPAENTDFSTLADWSKAPRGSNILGGVHFEIDGLHQLAGNESVLAKRRFREHVSLPAPTNRYAAVHLLAATSGHSEPNRRVADVLWRYTDGSLKRSPILHTGHVRSWWRKPFEEPQHVYSRHAKAAAVWSSPDADKASAVLRLYRVTLANPEPTRAVAALQIQSAMDNASLLVLAVSLDPLAPGQRPDPSPDLEPEDPQWTGHLGVTVIDAGTSNVIGGATVVAKVETSKISAERTYTANGSGIADVLTPNDGVTAITLTASATNYTATRISLKFGPTNPVPPFVSIRLQGGIDVGGIVVNTDGAPIPDANVRMGTRFGGTPRGARTDASGRFLIGGQAIGEAFISASAKGYAPEAQALNITPTTPEVRLTLKTGALFQGLVVDSDGNPLGGVRVRVDTMQDFEGSLGEKFADFSAQTGADGRWQWDSGPDTGLKFSFRKEGFARKSGVTIQPNASETVVTLSLPRQVEGIVIDDESSEPVTEFRLQPRGNGWHPADTRSFNSPDGRFTLPLEQEHFDRFQITSPTHEPAEEPIPNPTNGVIQMTIRLKKSEDLSGVVYDIFGNPVAGATVALTGGQSTVSLRNGRLESHSGIPVQISGPDGSFRLEATREPIAVVAASPDGFGALFLDDFRKTRRIDILPYGTVQGTYNGRTDDDGMARLNLSLFTQRNVPIGIADDWSGFVNPIAAGQTFSFTRVPPGNHQIHRLTHGGNTWAHDPLKDVRVIPGQTTTINIEAEGVRVIARLLDPPDTDMTGAQRFVLLQSASPLLIRPGMSPDEIAAAQASQDPEAGDPQPRQHACILRYDGSVVAEDLPAGTYFLSCSATEIRDRIPTRQFRVHRAFNVPEGSSANTVINLGNLQLAP
jgi:hypothetical protein